MFKIASFGVCLPLLLAACATTSGQASTVATQTSKQVPPAGCVATKPAPCTGLGNTYTFDDLQRTGATSTAGALRLLDPAITIRH